MLRKVIKLILSRRTVIIILLLLQASLMIVLLVRSAARYRVASLVLNVISIIVVFYIMNRNDKPGYKLTWIVLIMTFPVLGGILYMMFRIQSSVGRSRRKFAKCETQMRGQLAQDKAIIDRIREDNAHQALQARYLYDNAGFPIYENSQVEYLTSGEIYFARLTEQLKRAEKYIFLEYFIITHGYMWDTILAILKEKAAAGVDVRVIYDDMGCITTLPDKYYKTLNEAKIKCAVFNPFRPFWTTLQNNRDHRKIAVIDGKTAFTGGINLADEYINKIRRFGHWKDSGVMVTGEAVWSFAAMFLNMWNSIANTEEDFNSFRPSRTEAENGLENKNAASVAKNYVQPYGDSPIDDEYVGEHVYMQLINNARRYVYISTPYLIIDDNILSSLDLAAKSGVDVRIITPHIPDKKLVHLTTRSYYPKLIKAGVRIYEYKPGFIHSKMFVCDDETAISGTANLDFRSLYLHFECGVCMYGVPAIAAMKEDYLKTLDNCIEITPEFYTNQNVIIRILQDLVRFCAPLM